MQPPEGLEDSPLNMQSKQADIYKTQWMRQGISLKSE